VPYITSLSENHSASVVWVNSAHTWISIEDMDVGRYANFVSESGALELFVFASSTAGGSNRIKKVQENLATVSGFAPMPLFHMLGFHFCKWANVSAEMIMQRNKDFTTYGFPVDVFWMDIEWS
jgi:alpha-glucosidase (family GH31 glycosyl hydrolase)